MYRVLDATVPELPADRPRYLMGVGRPQDLLEAISPGHRPVRLRAADAQRPQRPGVHRRRHRATAQPAVRARPAAAWKRAALRRLPPQPGLPAAPVPGRRDAGADPASHAQPDLLPAVAGGEPGRRSPKTATPPSPPSDSGSLPATDPDGLRAAIEPPSRPLGLPLSLST